jgi:hypothetical protein
MLTTTEAPPHGTQLPNNTSTVALMLYVLSAEMSPTQSRDQKA